MGGVAWFVDDDASYLAWRAAQPDGHVLNCNRTPTAGYLKLHRVSCVYLEPERAEQWTAAFAKACASSAEELRAWSRARTGVDPDPCPACRP